MPEDAILLRPISLSLPHLEPPPSLQHNLHYKRGKFIPCLAGPKDPEERRIKESFERVTSRRNSFSLLVTPPFLFLHFSGCSLSHRWWGRPRTFTDGPSQQTDPGSHPKARKCGPAPQILEKDELSSLPRLSSSIAPPSVSRSMLRLIFRLAFQKQQVLRL